MIEVCIFLAVLYIILKSLQNEAKIRVSNCTTVLEANKIREAYDIRCKISAIIIAVLYFIYIFVLLCITGNFRVEAIGIPMYFWGYEIFKGFVSHPVSTFSIKDLNYNYYALFLRGFDVDNYNPENKLNGIKIENKKRKKERVDFSEAEMQKSLKNHCCNHTIAIGMPKEIFAPIGCERLYCEPDAWKQDVYHLINDSLFNVVLLNDRPSCLYELDHCFRVASKTYCIICDKNMYENLRETYNIFPPVSIQEPFFFRLDNAAMAYAYNPYDFAKQIKEDLINAQDEKIRQSFIEFEKENKEDKQYKRNKFGCYLVILITILVCIFFGKCS